MITNLQSNPLGLIRQERANGRIPADLAAKAEALIDTVQKEVFETSSRVNASGEYDHRPYWGTSAHQTSIKLDPEKPPTESEPLRGVSEFLTANQVFGKWGYDVKVAYSANSDKMVFQQTDQSVRDFSVTVNSNGTLTVDPGREIPIYYPLD